MTAEQIKENLLAIKEKISEAEKKSSRESGSVKLCAVSKFHPAEDVIAAMDAGQFLFGENRVQEACSKFSLEEIKKRNAELHIIGSLQSNKVKKAVEVASCIQSVDRMELLSEIEKRCAASDKKISVLFEVHTGEESKAGYTSEKDLFSSLEMIASGKFPHIQADGFMTMAPFTEDEKLVRSSFITLRELSEKARNSFPNLTLNELSMGMSGDFLWAIEEGSTMVRIGTAIFGERDYSAGSAV